MGKEQGRNATVDEVLDAIEAQDDKTWILFRERALRFMFGTRYAHPQELVNDACLSAIEGAKGEAGGRTWPVSVPFAAFLTNAMRGIASNERTRSSTRHVVLETELVGADQEDVDTSTLLDSVQSEDEKERQKELAVDKLLISAEERAELLRQYDAVYEWFKDDSEVTVILMAREDGLKAAEIQADFEMTKMQYETALKRLNRGMAKMQAREKEQ